MGFELWGFGFEGLGFGFRLLGFNVFGIIFGDFRQEPSRPGPDDWGVGFRGLGKMSYTTLGSYL